jgi:uncharacterized membrane protein
MPIAALISVCQQIETFRQPGFPHKLCHLWRNIPSFPPSPQLFDGRPIIPCMRTTSLNVGSALIATSPVFAAHCVFGREIRYILLAWFCSFVSTILLVICSLSALFTSNPWFILLYSIPFDSIGKAILKYFGCRQHFLKTPRARVSLGLSCGLGFALAHVLTMYVPLVFDQPYSVDFDDAHPDYFPNGFDLAFVNHAMSVFQMPVGLLWFRFTKVNIVIMFIVMSALQYAVAALSQIPAIAAKIIVLFIASYGLFIWAAMAYRSMDYAIDITDDKMSKDDKE